MGPLIKEVDIVLRVTEQRDIQIPIPLEFLESGKDRPDPLPEKIVPWSALEAENAFLVLWTILRADLHVEEMISKGRR